MEGLSLVCAGLGSIEEDADGNRIGYTKGEYCLDNLKDLLRFLRRDDPQSREVFKQVCKWNTVGKDLIPIIEHCQDDRNLVLNAVKVLVFLTMPVEPTSHDIPQQIDYLWALKSSITCSDAVPVVVSLLESPLENLEREALTEDDWKLIQLVLTLFRNFLAVQDIPLHQKIGASATQFLSLRDKFLEQLFQENVMDLILVLTQHIGGSSGYLREDNFLLLETFHYIFISQEPELIAKAYSKGFKVDGAPKASISSLSSIMQEEEEKRKLIRQRNLGCYSHLSGTFTRVTMDGSKTLFKGNPCSASRDTLLKSHKVHRGPLKRIAWDYGRFPSTTDSILELLHDFVNQLLSGVYNVLMQSIREDVEKEHHTVQNSDVIMFFQVAQFITCFQYHKSSLLKPKTEADPFEASVNHHADTTYFKGNICGPIAASMNESMFLLVISKWRYAYDGLKETNDYKFVSTAGSLMKIMIRLLDLVLKVSPEDSKEPQTARTLLYKLFYDQTDQGMTQFLLNQIKSFDTHKQSKSDLTDLVETTHVVIRLMENLQARGTLRVSRKSRKKRVTKRLNDNNDNSDHPVGDQLPLQNEVDSFGCEQPAHSSILSEEKLMTSSSDTKGEDTALPFQVDEPDTQELQTPDIGSTLCEMANRKSDEICDDIHDGIGDSSGDEQLAATDEVDFKVSTLVSSLANHNIIQNLCWLLKFYKSNFTSTNHYIISILRKVCDDLELSPMLYQLSLLSTFYNILKEQKSSPCKEYENIVIFLTILVRRMLRKMKSQPLLFMEVLFWKTRRECQFINCESLLHEVGNLKRENEKWGSDSKEGEFGSTQRKQWVCRSLADALGDDEADFVLSHDLDEQEEENPSMIKIRKVLQGRKGGIGQLKENITSISDDGNDGKEISDNCHSEGHFAHESQGVCKRRKTLVLDEDLEGKIAGLYEKYKTDRHCSRLIAEALDSDGKVSPVQVSNKLRQLGLRVRPKKRVLQDGGSNQSRGEEEAQGNENNMLNKNELTKGPARRQPLNTRKRVHAFSEDQEMAIKALFEQFKDHKRCSHMIANALGAGITAAQVSRKLKQLGLRIPQRRRSKANMHLRDEDLTIFSAESAEESDNETLFSLRKRSKNKKIDGDQEEVANKNKEGKFSEDIGDDEFLGSVFGKTRRLLQKTKDAERTPTLIKNTTTENDYGYGLDAQDVTERDVHEPTRREVAEFGDTTLHSAANAEAAASSITNEKHQDPGFVDDANGLQHQQLNDDLADQLSDIVDDATPVTSPKGIVLRRKLRMVIDVEDDE